MVLGLIPELGADWRLRACMPRWLKLLPARARAEYWQKHAPVRITRVPFMGMQLVVADALLSGDREQKLLRVGEALRREAVTALCAPSLFRSDWALLETMGLQRPGSLPVQRAGLYRAFLDAAPDAPLELNIWGADTAVGLDWLRRLAPRTRSLALGGTNPTRLEEIRRSMLADYGLASAVSTDPARFFRAPLSVVCRPVPTKCLFPMPPEALVLWDCDNPPAAGNSIWSGARFAPEACLPIPVTRRERRALAEAAAWLQLRDLSGPLGPGRMEAARRQLARLGWRYVGPPIHGLDIDKWGGRAL